MIHFFRRIRKSLLTENRFTNYLLYAIGEIMLVVIGILIALQINNWNEQNKIDQNNRVKLNSVQQELLTNLKTADLVISETNQKLSGINRVLYDTLTVDDYLERGSGWVLRTLMLSVTVFTPVTESYNSLILSQDNLSDSYNGIINNLNQIYVKSYKFIDLSNKGQQAIYFREVEHLSNSYSWYSDVNTNARNLNEHHIQYLLTNPFYKNRVSEMKTMANAMNQIAKIFKHQSIQTYKEISRLIDQNIEEPMILNAYYRPTEDEISLMISSFSNVSLGGSDLKILAHENTLYLDYLPSGKLEMFFTDPHSFYVMPSGDEYIIEYAFEKDYSKVYSMSSSRRVFTYKKIESE